MTLEQLGDLSGVWELHASSVLLFIPDSHGLTVIMLEIHIKYLKAMEHQVGNLLPNSSGKNFVLCFQLSISLWLFQVLFFFFFLILRVYCRIWLGNIWDFKICLLSEIGLWFSFLILCLFSSYICSLLGTFIPSLYPFLSSKGFFNRQSVS